MLLVEAMDTRDILLAIVIVALGAALVYFLDPTFGGLLGSRRQYMSENFSNMASARNYPTANSPVSNISGSEQESQVYSGNYVEGSSGLSPAASGFGASDAPENCYPKKQLKASELLPNDPNSQWVQANPMAPGSIMDKNFLNAGYQIGVDTIGQSLRNASHDLRSSPPNPQAQVGPWNQSTIEPDVNRKPLEIGA